MNATVQCAMTSIVSPPSPGPSNESLLDSEIHWRAESGICTQMGILPGEENGDRMEGNDKVTRSGVKSPEEVEARFRDDALQTSV